MDPLAPYRTFAGYNTWMNRRLYAHAAGLSDHERTRDRGAFFGSISNTLNHLLLADRIWMGRLTGDRERFTSRDAAGQPIAISSLRDVLYAGFDDLRRERAATDATIEAYVETLEPHQLDQPLGYKTTAGVAQEHPMWWALSQMFNHQTHHRGQVTTLLFQAGIDPGATDLLAYAREANAA